MTRRIQAYFRTEDEAEGAKTALISYKVAGLEVWPLTDPLDQGGDRDRNILVPLFPLNNSAMAGGAIGGVGTTGSVTGATIVPGIAAGNVLEDDDDSEDRSASADVRKSEDVVERDLKDLHYVMELKVPDEHYSEVVQILRGKHAFVEVFD